jgi:hypothetical protein
MTQPNDDIGPAPLVYIRHQTRFPDPKWFLGLDLGQRRDHSAVAVLDLSWIPSGQCKLTYAWLFEPCLVLRGLERVPLGVSYEEIHDIVAGKIEALEHRIVSETRVAAPRKEIILDAGGPGPPMVDRLRGALRGGAGITPVIITGGKGENSLSGGYTGIPRRSLITRLLQMISSRCIRCPAGLDGWDDFVREFLDLSGDSTQPDARGAHDDLVLATALAAWAAARDYPELVPGAQPKRIGHVDKRLF